MRIALWVLAGLVGLVLVAFLAGLFLPKYHAASSAVELTAEPESVWAVVRDLGGLPAWWPEVKSSTRLPDKDGHEAWRQEVSGFAMTFVITTDDPPVQFVSTIDAPADAAFGGTWTYEVGVTEGGSRVRVTERGWIANPLFRVFTVFSGQHGTLDAYLVALGRRFGRAGTPEHVAPPPAPPGWPGP